MPNNKSGKEAIYDRIKEVQRYLNVSNTQMAGALNVEPGTYRKQIASRSGPSLRSLVRLDQKYGISIEWLLFGRGHMLLKSREVEALQRQKETEERIEREVEARMPKNEKPKVDLFSEELKELETKMRENRKLRHSIMALFHQFVLDEEKG